MNAAFRTGGRFTRQTCRALGRRRPPIGLVALGAVLAISCVGRVPGSGPPQPRPATPPGVPILPPPARILRAPARPPTLPQPPRLAPASPVRTPPPTPVITPRAKIPTPPAAPQIPVRTPAPPPRPAVSVAPPPTHSPPTPVPTVPLPIPTVPAPIPAATSPAATPPPATPTPALSANANRDVAKFTFTVSLDSLGDIEGLEHKRAVSEAIEMAMRHPEAQIYIAAYVTDADSRARHGDPASVSDELVIQTARFLADHGVDPNRIIGKGEGINAMIGRAVVISFDLSPEPVPKPPKPPEFAGLPARDPLA